MPMTKEVRCPKCKKRLFDVTEETVGLVTVKCGCKDKVLVRYYSFEKIIYKTK